MTDHSQSPTATMSTPAAATYIANAVGGTPLHWARWLANERRPERVNRQLPCEPGPGRPRYAKERIDSFVSAYIAKKSELKARDKMKRPVVRDKRFAAHISAVTQDEGANVPFVLVVTGSPIRTYQLTATEARSIAQRLVSSANEIDSPQAHGQLSGVNQH